jgi:hypothetical protein
MLLATDVGDDEVGQRKSGNSGGPLLDSAGRLIGVNTMIFSPSGASAGVGFAVPVDTVNRVVPQLIASGKYARPTLGVEVDERLNQPITERLRVSGVAVSGSLLVPLRRQQACEARGSKIMVRLFLATSSLKWRVRPSTALHGC